MRITGGVLRGRLLRVPRRGVRPTQDKVRQALFSVLAQRIEGCRFLDLCAGSGAVGIEAWSRGASFVCWVERDPLVVRDLKENVRMLCGDDGMVWAGDAAHFLKKRLVDQPFDVVFCDPPYAENCGSDMIPGIVAGIAAGDMLAPGGCVVVERGSGAAQSSYAGWTTVMDRKYGQACLQFLRTGTDGLAADIITGGRK